MAEMAGDQDALKVLVVEDDFLIAMDIEMQLQDMGCEVVGIATTAGEAVLKANEAHPNVALVDLRLADGSWGGDAAREMLESQGIRSVFISGNLDPDTRQRLAPLKPFAMLSKPFMPGQLASVLATVVAQAA